MSGDKSRTSETKYYLDAARMWTERNKNIEFCSRLESGLVEMVVEGCKGLDMRAGYIADLWSQVDVLLSQS